MNFNDDKTNIYVLAGSYTGYRQILSPPDSLCYADTKYNRCIMKFNTNLEPYKNFCNCDNYPSETYSNPIIVRNNLIYIAGSFGLHTSVAVLKEDFPQFSENNLTKNNLTISPNPTSDFLIINNITNKYYYKIINPFGQTILDGYVDYLNNKINISSLTPNLSIININNISYKFIKL
jgi:hypothetical protein